MKRYCLRVPLLRTLAPVMELLDSTPSPGDCTDGFQRVERPSRLHSSMIVQAH